MRSIAQLIAFAAALAFALPSGKAQTTDLPPDPPEGIQDTNTTGWSRAHLKLAPALLEQMHQAEDVLGAEGDGDGLGEEISGLKAEGLLDRRSASKIRTALDHARGSITQLAGAAEEERRLDGWTARMIAYELGMAADTLAQQADELGADTDSGRGEAGEQSAALSQRRHLADAIRQCGSLLKETARAIVRHLN